jgi:mono/diheme cytochrome c family protein
MNGLVAFTLWKSDLRHFVVLINIIAIVALAGFLIWSVYSRRSPEKAPPNQVRFLSDDDLEGRRLERVLGWSLMFVTIFAVVMLVYLVREPARQDESIDYFDEGAVARGRTLFANSSSEYYDSVLSLQCANCHGSEGGGGSATQVIDPDGPDGPQPPESHIWKAPALNTERLRFSEEEVEQIITFGRPGTPMQAFGVAGGGAENTQTIKDLVAYIDSIQLSPEEAKAQAEVELNGDEEADIVGWRDEPQAQLEEAEVALNGDPSAEPPTTGARGDLAAAKDALTTALGVPASTSNEELRATCEGLERELDAAGEPANDEVAAQGQACRAYLNALDTFDEAEAALTWSQAWADSRVGVTDGQLLFELYCARCHTKGWSIFDPAEPNGTSVLGLPGGGGGQGGGIGFNLRDGATIRRFGEGDEPGELGFDAQVEFITNGSDANVQYGNGGSGTGKMPGFGSMLTEEMITAIVTYERTGLDSTTYLAPAPTTTAAPSDTTTTTGG